MKLSTRGRYAVRALLELALNEGTRPAQLKDIARRQEIPLRYLQHLVAPLIAAGIVRSTRGPRGGVSLQKSPGEIKLSEIVQLFEGSLALVECTDTPAVCRRSAICATRDVWIEVKKAMDNVLESTTLRELVERQREKQTPAMYYL